MVDTIEKVLYPLSLTAFFFGFGIFRYPANHPRLRFSIFYILAVWSGYTCVFYYVLILFSPSLFNGFLNFFTVIVNLLVTMISIITAVCKYEKYHTCIKKLGLVDDTLEKLGTPKEYRRMQNSIKWILIMVFTTFCMILAMDSLWFMEKLNDTRAIVTAFVMDYSIYINTFMDITFMFLLRYIGTRLDKLNNYIVQLSENEECELKYTVKKYFITPHRVRSSKNHKHILWITMHLHSELCRIAHNLNGFYEIQMTVQMISYFVILIGLSYFKYHTMLCLKRMYGYAAILKSILSTDMWYTICLTKLILFNFICESVSTKAQNTKNMIHKLSNLTRFTGVREEICQFTLQISLRPLKINGMGLFCFGYKFIRKFFIWILTAVIFIIQVDTSSKSRITISGKSNTTCYD